MSCNGKDATIIQHCAVFGNLPAQKTYPISIAAGRIAPGPIRFFVGLPCWWDGTKLVIVDVAKFDAIWRQDIDCYVGHSGIGSNQRHKYENFKTFVSKYRYIKAAEVNVRSDGSVGFINGRHRYAVMRDAGVKKIPIAMKDESISNATQYGYLKKAEWLARQAEIDHENAAAPSGVHTQQMGNFRD